MSEMVLKYFRLDRVSRGVVSSVRNHFLSPLIRVRKQCHILLSQKPPTLSH